MIESFTERVLRLARWLQLYHRYRVIGMENIPASGPGLVAISHSLATYDGLLLGAAIYQQLGRICRGLGDRLIFKTPLLADWATKVGMVEGSPPSGMQLLDEGNLVIMAPGGMLESLRPRGRRYQICWDHRLGFVRLAVRARVPILLAACPRADDIYRVYDNPLTQLVYQRLKMPLPLARGLGLTAIPRPVRLTHHISEPIFPPEIPEGEHFEEGIRAFHAAVMKQMRELMARALRED
jgi:1-acyl-sn-glycerol-3-phosphate acyltransferase